MSDIENRQMLQIQRCAAWERVKGELNAILEMYVSESQLYEDAKDAFDEFVSRIEEQSIGGLS